MIKTVSFNPPVIAHRGASAYAPENTLSAFTKAIQLGLKWIEFDVVLAACGEPVIFHDETLERTTNGKGQITQYSYQYLSSLDAGRWFDPKFAGERIPSLRQTMAFLENADMNVNIEIKPSPGSEELLVKHIIEIVEPYLYAEQKSILFSSFSVEVLEILRKYAPNCSMGLLLHEWEPDWEEICESLQCAAVDVNHEIMTPEAAEHIKKMNRALLCYTVNDPKRAKELYGWGVDAVFSDVPDKILRSL